MKSYKWDDEKRKCIELTSPGLKQRIEKRKKRYCRCQQEGLKIGIICFSCTVFNKDLTELDKTIAEIKVKIRKLEKELKECPALYSNKAVIQALKEVLKALDSKEAKK